MTQEGPPREPQHLGVRESALRRATNPFGSTRRLPDHTPPSKQRISRAVTAAAQMARLCSVLGHELDNRKVTDDGPHCRRCHQPFLFEDGRITHTRHVLGCMLRHHTYLRIDRRAHHNEYVCLRCGHSLLLAIAHDPHLPVLPFPKRLRYWCAVFGHAVHEVTVRGGFTEYACKCGHSFLLAGEGLTRVAHPLVCRVSGHNVAFVERRGRYREHRCLDCGHPFLSMS